MHHDEIQVSHRRPHHGRVGVVGVEPHDEFMYECRHVVDLRALVHDVAGRFVANEDRACSPEARTVLEVVAGHHEVQALQEPLAVAEVVVGRECEDVGHGIAVALDREPRFFVGVERLFAEVDGGGIVKLRVVTLNAVRALNCTGELDASK